MDAIELLKKYKERVEPFLEGYFERKIKEAKKVDPLAKQAVKIIKDFTMSGGKRIRPALVYYGYLASGGRDGKEIVEASAAIELIHSFLLIHDDIIDRDEKRHGVKTVHERYKEIGKNFVPREDNEHFGNSMAIITGDMANAMANEIMFNSKFPPEIIIKALDRLQGIVYSTSQGEMLDVVMENRGNAKEDEILQMFEGKTSRYTFEGPLHLGCILAGGDSRLIQSFTKYSLPLGKAFQIRDDILGVFGDEKKTGKPVGSDVSEGKQTLLLTSALKNGNSEQRKKIKKYLGKSDLTKKELEDFRTIVCDTGSLEYSQNLAKKFVEEALFGLRNVEFKNREAGIFLRGIANYIIERQK